MFSALQSLSAATPPWPAMIKTEGTKSPASSTRNNATGARTGNTREVIAMCMALATLIAGWTAILIVVWITSLVTAAAGHVIIPVIATGGRIISTAGTHVAGTTTRVRAGTRRHDRTTARVMV